MDLDEEVREFLIECNENLINLDREVVLLEKHPSDATLIASVFRTFHTIKGTCGFFGFNTLGSVTHIAENILDQVRARQRELTPDLTSLILQTVDAIKALLSMIETEGNEGADEYHPLRARLTAAYQNMSPNTAPAEIEASAVEEVDSLVTPLQPAVHSVMLFPEVTSKEAEIATSAPDVAVISLVKVAERRPEKTEPGSSADSNGAPKNSVLIDSTIRVDVGLLDKLMNLVGELVLARNQLLEGTTGQDGVLIRTVQRLNVITSELQEGVMKTRMQQIGVVWNKLPRVIRDLAAECGKKIQIEMEGAETELDKTIIEAIKDPLTHIVRNSCDHGIEAPEVRLKKGKSAEGLILLRAYHEGGHVNIEISDDGAGLDAEKLKARAVQKGLIRQEQASLMPEREAVHLVFMPGFSTAEQITNISGRGVGMDVVKTNIQKIGGIVDICNRPGTSGSTVKIKIPLTLAIIPGLVIKALCDTGAAYGTVRQEHRFVIPQANLLELVRLEHAEDHKKIEYVSGTPVYRRRGQLLPLTYLNSVLGMATSAFPSSDVVNIVVLQAEDRPFGLIVDGIFDTQEIVVKPLGKRLKGLSSYLGATIMGDGRVALILDVAGLARLAGIVSQSRDAKRLDTATADSQASVQQTFLIFRAGRFQRLAVPLALVARLEQFPRKSVALASGRPVLHYCEQILPLLALDKLLDAELDEDVSDPDTIQVIVFGEGSRRVGVVVDHIVDIIEEAVTVTQSSSHVGLLGSAVIGGTIADVIDLYALLEFSGETSLSHDTGTTIPKRILIVDSSSMTRTMLRSYLEMRGYSISEAASGPAALELLQSTSSLDLVITAMELGSQTGFDLLTAIRMNDALSHLRVMTLVTQDPVLFNTLNSASRLHFDAVELSGDRAQLHRTIQTVLSMRSSPVAG